MNGAAPSTVEALVYALRSRGLSALNDANNLVRLSELSDAQLRQVKNRLAKIRGRHPKVSDDLLTFLQARTCHGGLKTPSR